MRQRNTPSATNSQARPPQRRAGPRPPVESDGRYPSLRLNDRWRVIECRDDIQWILQYRNRAETVARGDWRGRAYCTTRDGLIRCCDRYCGPFDPGAAVALEALPEQFPTARPARRSPDAGSALRDAFQRALMLRVDARRTGRIVLPTGIANATEVAKVLHAIERARGP